MKKFLIPLAIVLGILLMLYAFFVERYNTLVTMDEEVKTAWGQVENQYQRRFDLIPNLVETVKGFAEQEKEVFIGVTEARAKVGQMNVTPQGAEDFTNFMNAQEGLSSALSRLMVVVEKYPEIKSNTNFLELQAQLEGTENRISVERMRYNDTVKAYNTYVRKFPTNLIAGMFGFVPATLFDIAEGVENAPKVEF